jgi:hypothetical protein
MTFTRVLTFPILPRTRILQTTKPVPLLNLQYHNISNPTILIINLLYRWIIELHHRLIHLLVISKVVRCRIDLKGRTREGILLQELLCRIGLMMGIDLRLSLP